ncbi:MAG: hypothetical protein OHK0019_12010 [Saprospiraceae bacterium]
MTDVSNLSLPEWHRRTDAALAWLRRSIEVTGGQGSSHSWSPLFGWAKSYPETTGYLVETLLDYAALKQDDSLQTLASQCVNWLVSIQLPSGAFPGLLVGHKKPSVFNTAMILFGLSRETSSPSAKESLERAVDWLVSTLEPDFSWRKHSYVPGFTPSYYSRAVWGVLQANQILQNPENEEKMRHALHFYAQRFLPNAAVRDWGFWPDKLAFTHTMAYTYEGFLESALLLGEGEILPKIVASGVRFLEIKTQAGNRTAGRYDERWRGDYSFLCVTGNCQFSVFFHRLWERTGEDKFRCAANSFLSEILDFQYLGKNRNRFGALPGSAPVWGPYLRFRYPNWGVKFFLDAMRLAFFRLRKA